MVGTIKWYNPRRKYGFIQGDDERSYFIHETNIVSARKYEGFEAGDEVVFDIGTGRKGKTQAEHVVLRDDQTVTNGRHVGAIKWFDNRKNYGFIEEGENQTHFVHFSCVDKAREYIGFNKGDKVEFDEQEGNKGPMAVNCRLVAEDE